MRLRIDRDACAIISLVWLNAGAPPRPPENRLLPVSRVDLCVSEGEIEELPGQKLSMSVPKMRAYLNLLTPQLVDARFKYLGSPGNEARLGPGELRRQSGLKLRAQDACNLVYAMCASSLHRRLWFRSKAIRVNTRARSAAIEDTRTSSRAAARPSPHCGAATRTIFAPK